MPTSVLPVLQLCFLASLVFTQTVSPESCRPGSFFDRTQCRLCPPGTFSNTFGATRCLTCRKGTFNSNEGAQGEDLCLPCPAGTFNDVPGRSFCKPCPPDTGSSLRAVICRTCLAGLHPLPVFSKCAVCDGRSITTEPNSAVCTQCPTPQASNIFGTMCEPCPPGQELVRKRGGKSEYICRLCNSSSFNDGTLPACVPCPQGMSGNGDRTRCVFCKSGTARQFLRRGCQKCAEDENVGARGSSLCLPPRTPCPSNYFLTPRGGCISCNRGQRFDPDSKKCVDCGDKEESDGGLSTTCRPCGVLQIRSPTGCVCLPGHELVNSRECRPCPAGFVPDRNGVCALCQTGSIATKSGSTECTKCPEGTESSFDGRQCDECKEGETFILSRIRSTFVNEAGDLIRLLNLDGTFSVSSGICVDPLTNCPSETVRIPGSSFPPVCRPTSCPRSTIPIEFPPNNITAQTTFECGICNDVRTFFNTTSNSCRRCAIGSFAVEPDATSCVACEDNRTVQIRARGDGMMQARCGCVGKYAFRNGACRRCPRRRIAETVAWGDATRCVFCPPGTGDNTGSRDINICRECRPGFFAASSSTCERCPSGFTSGFGSSECVEIGSL